MLSRILTKSALVAGLMGLASGALALDGLAGSYLAARQAERTNDFQAAARYYAQSILRDSANPALLEQTIAANLALGTPDRAVPVARRLIGLGQNSQVAQMVLTAEDALKGRFDQIASDLSAGQGIGPLVDGLARGWALLGAGQTTAALETFDEIANTDGLAAFATHHKALALGVIGRHKAALALLQSGAAGSTQRTRGSVIAQAELLSQLGRNPEALSLLGAVFGSQPDPEIASLTAQLQADDVLAFNSCRTVQDGIAEVFYTVGEALRGEAPDSYALFYARVSEYLRADYTPALLLTAGLLEDLQKYDLAAAAYQRVPEESPAHLTAELGRSSVLRSSDKLEAAIDVLKALAETYPRHPQVQITLGDTYRQAKKYALAVGAYDAAFDLMPEANGGQWFVYYARGISHERLDHWPMAEADFRTALRLNPNQPQVMNYLGYSMVEKGINLPEALDLIKRAVAARPDNGYIVDSLGWVLFRLGRYQEAVPHMEKAAELMAVDPIVNDHLGDVYWAVGRRTEARFQWHRALSFEPEPDEVERIRRKLAVGLDVVLEEEGTPLIDLAEKG